MLCLFMGLNPVWTYLLMVFSACLDSAPFVYFLTFFPSPGLCLTILVPLFFWIKVIALLAYPIGFICMLPPLNWVIEFHLQMATQETAPASGPSAEVVGNAFVEQYYHILHESPELVHRFYQDSSSLSRPNTDGFMTTVTTMQVCLHGDFQCKCTARVNMMKYGDFSLAANVHCTIFVNLFTK